MPSFKVSLKNRVPLHLRHRPKGVPHFSNMPLELIINLVYMMFENYADELNTARELDEKLQTAVGRPEEHGIPFKKQAGVWKDVASLAATNTAFRALITPILYRQDAKLNGSSALIISSWSGVIETARLALEHGADPEATHPGMSRIIKHYEWTHDDYQYPSLKEVTCLHWACGRGHEDVVDLLLEHAVDVNRVCNGNAATDNHCSCCGLDEHDPEPYAMTLGANALFLALVPRLWSLEEDGRRIRIAYRLIKAGSSLTTHTDIGVTALHQAIVIADVGFVRYLLNRGLDPNVPCRDGRTGLHCITDSSWIRNNSAPISYFSRKKLLHRTATNLRDLARLLIDRGADLDARRFDTGDTPMSQSIARLSRFHVLVLLSAGAQITEEQRGELPEWWNLGLRLRNCTANLDVVDKLRRDPLGYWSDALDFLEDTIGSLSPGYFLKYAIEYHSCPVF